MIKVTLRTALLLTLSDCQASSTNSAYLAKPDGPGPRNEASPSDERLGELLVFQALDPDTKISGGFSFRRPYLKLESTSSDRPIFDGQFPFTGVKFVLPAGDYKVTTSDLEIMDDMSVRGRVATCQAMVTVDPRARVEILRLNSATECRIERTAISPSVAISRERLGADPPTSWWWIRIWAGASAHPHLEVALPPQLSAVYLEPRLPSKVDSLTLRISASISWTGRSHRVCQHDFTDCGEFLTTPHCEASFSLEKVAASESNTRQRVMVVRSKADQGPAAVSRERMRGCEIIE